LIFCDEIFFFCSGEILDSFGVIIYAGFDFVRCVFGVFGWRQIVEIALRVVEKNGYFQELFVLLYLYIVFDRKIEARRGLVELSIKATIYRALLHDGIYEIKIFILEFICIIFFELYFIEYVMRLYYFFCSRIFIQEIHVRTEPVYPSHYLFHFLHAVRLEHEYDGGI
jgi:hypothetical protein